MLMLLIYYNCDGISSQFNMLISLKKWPMVHLWDYTSVFNSYQMMFNYRNIHMKSYLYPKHVCEWWLYTFNTRYAVTKNHEHSWICTLESKNLTLNPFVYNVVHEYSPCYLIHLLWRYYLFCECKLNSFTKNVKESYNEWYETLCNVRNGLYICT